MAQTEKRLQITVKTRRFPEPRSQDLSSLPPLSSRRLASACEFGHQSLTLKHIKNKLQFSFNQSTTGHQTISLLFPTEVDSNLPQKMTPSDAFWRGLVTGMVIASIITFLLMGTSRHEQRAKKRGPEENDDNSFWQGNFEVKIIQLCWLWREIAHNNNLKDKNFHPPKFVK